MHNSELPWTGERLVPSLFNYGAIDHLHRYAIAISIIQGKKVLDIASGEGYGSYLMAEFANNVIGVDISSEAIEHSREKYKRQNLTYKLGSADSIPVEDNTIDVVVSFETIEHHDKHVEMLQEIKRVLKPDGMLIMSSPDKLNYSDIPKYNNPFHIKELFREEFRSLIKQFFSNAVFLNQKSVFGSLIVPENSTGDFSEFKGDYSRINNFEGLQSPIYNICIASQNSLPSFGPSFFCGRNSSDYPDADKLAALQTELNSIKSSRGYKLIRRIRSYIKL
jgi:ubiquinone/menaquinone biosynthesis C-methylase UbiE